MTSSGNVTGEPPTLEQFREQVAEVIGLRPSEIDAEANLVHLGVDSLSLLRLMNQLRRSGVRLKVADLAAEPTLAAWHRHVAACYDVTRRA
jgi:aryl carrier-like protein